MSGTKIDLKIEVKGKGNATAVLYRHLSPLTLGILLRNRPIEGRTNRFEDKFVYILTSVIVGSEKGKKNFKRGDVAFLPSNSAICFFMKDTSTARSLNPLGSVTQGIELFQTTGPGDQIVLTFTES